MGIAMKAVPWSFFVGALGFATNSLTGNSNLVTKIYFPREVLPLAATLAQVADSAIGLSALLVAGLFLGVHFGAAALWAPVLVLLIAFTAGSALVVSCANLFFRDVKYIVQVLLSFGIFFTPVFFEPEMLGPTGARLMMLNPLAPILEGLRLASSTITTFSRRWSRAGVMASSWCGRPGISFPVWPGPSGCSWASAVLPPRESNSRSACEGAGVAEGRVAFEQVWKKFRRGEIHDSLRDLSRTWPRRLFRRNADPKSSRRTSSGPCRTSRSRSARDEALGIIGPNGAGKSTMLKMLTRILRPTAGRCGMRGRVGALIEVAGGISSGSDRRENVFLQGSIMGMTRRRDRREFDEIVEFSGSANSSIRRSSAIPAA